MYKKFILIGVCAMLAGLPAQAQIFRLSPGGSPNIPNIKRGTATVAFEPFDPGAGRPDLPSFLLTTVVEGDIYRANGQGNWTFHNQLYADPYEFDLSAFSGNANLNIDVDDVALNADRFNPTEYTYLIGSSGGNFYAIGMIRWVDGGGVDNLRMPDGGYTLGFTGNDVTSADQYQPDGSSTPLIVPEPATAGLVLLGLGALALRRRRS